MKKEFVPYELALKLKELGFKNDYNFKEYDNEGYLQHTGLLESHKLEAIDAPLWQQAVFWFILPIAIRDIRKRKPLGNALTDTHFTEGKFISVSSFPLIKVDYKGI